MKSDWPMQVNGFVRIAGRKIVVTYPHALGSESSRLFHALEVLVPIVEDVTSRDIYGVYVQAVSGREHLVHAFKFVFSRGGVDE